MSVIDSQDLPRSGKTNSPFRYPGGKFFARKYIIPEIPRHDVYCEPFAGGASIFFGKPKVKVNILNDLDFDVINTMRIIRDNVEEMIYHLAGVGVDRDTYNHYKLDYKPTDDLTRAVRWYYLNRTSYSGQMKSPGWGYVEGISMPPYKWPPHLRTVSDKLQDVRLTVNDFEIVIDSVPDDTYLFVDPPYYSTSQDSLYTCSFDVEDHIRLSECLKKNKDRVKFLMTYDDCIGVRRLYKWSPYMFNREWTYRVNNTNYTKGERELGQELFIRNYPI